MLARSLLLGRADVVTVASRAASAAATPSKPADAAAKPKGPKVKTFEIYRWNPEKPGSKPVMQVREMQEFFISRGYTNSL
ncbi:unnamed protein product [Strongylus vulgaris]|uniref:Uncharacterized protein n=1 Tax=Strongylus vulgaris TaxID=40348 RepID=A0A3P7IUQ6_STRVU|nr:unnamed protein product [Strongylus vulgaris]